MQGGGNPEGKGPFLVQDRDKWRAAVKVVMNPRVLYSSVKFLPT